MKSFRLLFDFMYFDLKRSRLIFFVLRCILFRILLRRCCVNEERLLHTSLNCWLQELNRIFCRFHSQILQKRFFLLKKILLRLVSEGIIKKVRVGGGFRAEKPHT